VTEQAQLLPGTLDLLILRAVSLGPLHGYGILLRIGQISGNALLIEQGALYPGVFRLVGQGCSRRAGAHRRTLAAQSSTNSLPLPFTRKQYRNASETRWANAQPSHLSAAQIHYHSRYGVPQMTCRSCGVGRMPFQFLSHMV